VSKKRDLLNLSRSKDGFVSNKHFMFRWCLWKEILPQQRIKHFKILQSIYFAYDVGIITSYSNRMFQ